MQLVRLAQAVVLLAALGFAGAGPAQTKKNFEEATSADGLAKVKVKGIDLAYARPGLTLAAYSKIMLDPIPVTFRKDFDPKRTGSRIPVATADLERIRSEVAKIVQDEFAKELAKGSYVTVTAAGPDVLQVRAEITDLYVNAPDTMEAGRSRTYTTSAGEMTLILELADSETGAVLARAYDRREARDTGTFSYTNSVTNRAEAERMANAWARILRARLDAARGIGK